MSEPIPVTFFGVTSPFGIRNKLIVVLRESGMQYVELGRMFHISAPRACQIYSQQTRLRWYRRSKHREAA